ncbi:2-C-methyl-D-erythritol 4-phosphate cytidylyltransferase [Pseudonocardia ailaonensis]|uniref:2-C-methyl-D-erythritol 4-phosphate cytidylyltransferase n=1 Tax=Pseudonocardia ailaonensis TaxID=367279 RepID=A0ABN2MVE4_9PSEU
MSVAAVVPAAGSGTRLGAALPKAFVPLAGVPIVVRAVGGLLDSGAVDEVVVAVPGDLLDRARELFVGRPVRVLAGGGERTASVRLALELLCGSHGGERPSGPAGDGPPEVVLVHDAARPLTPPALIASVVAAVRAGHPAVVPALPLADTVKQVCEGAVERTVDRSELRAVQTPQGFAYETLRRAYEKAGDSGDTATDDAGLVERLGEPVVTVPGDPAAFKVTTAWDLRIAELLLEGS